MTEEQENGETSEARRQRAFKELVRLSEEMDIYDLGPQVCVSHLRFVPCRGGADTGPCSLSDSEEDIDRISQLQRDAVQRARDEYRRAHGGLWES